MTKFFEFCCGVAMLSLGVAVLTISWWVVSPDTSAAKAPPCVVTGDGRGQKKEWK